MHAKSFHRMIQEGMISPFTIMSVLITLEGVLSQASLSFRVA